MSKAKETRNNYIEQRLKARIMQVENHSAPPKIEHHIPIPVENRGGVRKFDHFYPFEKMKIGDSFWVDSNSDCTCGAITRFAKKSGWKFVSRAQSIDGRPNVKVGRPKRGRRVWRVA